MQHPSPVYTEDTENINLIAGNSFIGAVLYCDGSCRPSVPGYVGWGVHGYFYNETPEEHPVVVDDVMATVLGYVSKEKYAPLSDTAKKMRAPATPLYYFDFLGSSHVIQTNNSAEIMAIYYGLLKLSEITVETIIIHSDSMQSVDGAAKWCHDWARRNWVKADGTEPANLGWWKLLYKLLQDYKAKGTTIKFYHIPAHSGYLGNETADILAGTGMSHSRGKDFTRLYYISEPKNYWKPKVERNPFFYISKLYFNSVKEHNSKGLYHMASSVSSDFILGKPSADSGYCVLRLNEPDSHIENIKQRQFDLSDGQNAVIGARMDDLFGRKIHRWVNRFGTWPIVKYTRGLSTELIDKTLVTKEETPVGLSLRAIDHFSLLEEILRKYETNGNLCNGWSFNGSIVHAKDVTDHFYETIPNPKNNKAKPFIFQLKPKYIVGYCDDTLTVDVEYQGAVKEVSIPIVLGLDLPNRNSLKNIETQQPKVSLITWKDSDKSIRHACIITCDGGAGI